MTDTEKEKIRKCIANLEEMIAPPGYPVCQTVANCGENQLSIVYVPYIYLLLNEKILGA